jgi:hypothetical protein
MKEFSQAVCEKLGYYVYVLKDPRNGEIFYVGKGKDNRIFQHIYEADLTTNVSDKLERIRDIGNDKVEHYILRHGLTKELSLEIESACIDLIGLDNLSNIVKGHNSWERGLKNSNEIVQYYDAKIVTITEPTIIITINKYYERFITEDKLYAITRSAWKVSKQRRDNVEYAIASYRGLVREIYKINCWHFKSDENRWAFDGEKAEPEIRNKYINQSLDNYIKKGSQNPIRYTF